MCQNLLRDIFPNQEIMVYLCIIPVGHGVKVIASVVSIDRLVGCVIKDHQPVSVAELQSNAHH